MVVGPVGIGLAAFGPRGTAEYKSGAAVEQSYEAQVLQKKDGMFDCSVPTLESGKVNVVNI